MPTTSADNKTHLERNWCARSEGTLGTLLEHDEYLLHKVLVHLVDDGLHECRRVCRFWRKVCSTLPVKIRQMLPDAVPVVLRNFPNATSLVVRSAILRENDATRYGISLLPRLRHLRRLHLSCRDSEAIPAGRQWWLGSMDSLSHLSLGIESQMAYRNAIEAIRKLTQIESLRLDFLYPVQLDPHPITEVQRLKFLSAPFNVLVNEDGELLFPSLTQLTELKSTSNFWTDERRLPELQVRQFHTPLPSALWCLF